MPVLNVGGRKVTVDDTFLSLSPDEQNETVDEIAGSLGIGASEPEPAGKTVDMNGQAWSGGVPVGGAPMAGQEAKPQPADPKFGGAAMNTTAGINEALYGVAGLPVDAMRGGMNLAARGINAVAGTDIPQIPEDSFGGSRSIAQAAGALRPELDPANTEAKTGADRVWRGVGQGIGGAVAPAGAVGLAKRAGVAVSPLVEAMAGRSSSVGAVSADAVAGGAAGAGAATAQEFTSDKYDPLSGLVGGLGGGLAGTAVTGLPALTRAVAEATGNFTAPMRQAGRERLAGERLVDAASDPRAAMRKLDEAQAPLVPGSNPTTFQQTGDMGLGALEREAQTKSPAQFMQRRAEQNTARREALDGIQPQGSPEQVSRILREQVDAIDAETTKAMGDAQEWEGSARRALGSGQAPEEAGNAMRGKLQAARDAAKAREDQLWQAVDPDGTLALPAENARKFVRDFLPTIPASARRPGGEEAAIYEVLRQYGDVSSFREVQALQSRVKTEMRRERMEAGETPAYGRLAQLNSALFKDLESAAVRKAEVETQAVAAGTMREEDTMLARWAAKKDEWLAERQTVSTGGAGGASSVGNAGASSPSVPSQAGAGRQAGGRSGGPAGDPRLSGQGLETNFDDAALGRLNEARDATNARAATFDNATLKPTLRRPATNAPYQMRDASVAKNIFTSGAGSFEKIQTYRQAVGNDPEALGSLEAYAVDSLRKAAIDRDTGQINPAKLEGWRRSHADALRAFPELDIKIGTAGDAARAVEQAATARKAALDETQRGALGRLIGVEDPESVRNIVGGLFSRQDAAEQLSTLRRRVGGDKDAAQGLRKAVADHVMTRFVSNTEAATSGRELLRADQLQTFVKTNRNALRAVFTEPEVKVLEAVAADLQRANRSNASVKIPNQSNTAQDQRSILQNVMNAGLENWTTVAGGTAGAAVAGAPGALAGGGLAALFNAMRLNGINAVDDLVRDALLNPERARFLMAKVPTDQKQADFMFGALARRYVKAATVGAAVDPKDEKPKRGPIALPPWMTQADPPSALQRALAER